MIAPVAPLGGEAQSPYRWVVVGVSATVNSLAWSVRSTFAVFYVALLGEFAWRRGEAALGYSLSWLLLLVFSPLAGWLYDRWGARLLVPAGGILLGVALALTGHVTTLWQYYLAFGVLAGAGIAGIQMPAAAVVSRWFVRSRGVAMGIISAGASASAIVFYPLNTWLIVTFGWREALAIFGLLVAVVTIPLAAFFYRDPPDTREHSRGLTVDPPPMAGSDWTLGMALRSVPFWAVFAMWGFGVIGYQIVTTHQVAHALDRGFSAVTLGWLFGLSGVCTVAGNVLGGALSDRWGREWVFALGSAIGMAGIGCLAWLDGPEHFWRLLGYVVSGVGFGMRISLLAAIPTDLFAGRHLGVILGAAHGGGGLGGFIGPFLGGWLFDVTGSYRIAFAVAALAIGASALAAWIAAPRRARAMASPSPRAARQVPAKED
ncbi:MAG TPA: MFS transporter [Methylomirabilota bacterium]|nr:MFS transporter [Methylomirabilota bacterium]